MGQSETKINTEGAWDRQLERFSNFPVVFNWSILLHPI
jgi:hypothetical protein